MNPDEQTNYWQEAPKDDSVEPELETPDAPDNNMPEEIDEPEERDETADDQDPDDAPINWTASEYIHIEKNGIWYLLFTIVAIGLIASDIFLIKSYTFSALIIVMVIAFIVHARRPPRMVQYTLSGKQGLYVGERLYHYSDFASFGIVQDGEHHSIMLIPTKRFSPSVTVYFPEELGEEIVDMLGARLPMKPLKLDTIDQIVRKLRL